MSSEIDLLVERLVSLPRGDPNQIGHVLGVSFRTTEVSPPMRYFEGSPHRGPLKRVDVRRNEDTGLTFVVLDMRSTPRVRKRDIDMKLYGRVQDVWQDLHMRRDGRVTYLYKISGVLVGFSFTASSEVLHTVSLEWPGARQVH
jgi:hypothetical protein